MKMFWLPIAVLACTVLLGGADRAAAQRSYPYDGSGGYDQLMQRSTVSPYIGLVPRGNNFNSPTNLALRYYSTVRPEFQTREALGMQQAEQNRLSGETENLQKQLTVINPFTQPGANARTGASSTIRPTGHGTSLMNTAGYFGGGGSGSGSRGVNAGTGGHSGGGGYGGGHR